MKVLNKKSHTTKQEKDYSRKVLKNIKMKLIALKII